MAKLALGLACLAAAATAVPSGGDKAVLNLNGTWLTVAASIDGKPLPEADLAETKLTAVFQDGKYTLFAKGQEVETGTYRLDPSRTPIAVDVRVLTGQDKGKTPVGILRIDGDRLTLVLDMSGKVRPRTFAVASGNEVVILQRKK